ncbi:pre-mRNA-splicing factor 38 [Ctenocephalides felis]|uniref:pre-mRNA-splicing factor 38 n=1 Tax=Ctenocephalides felis TaxID=7515 RepID=UPI000E6E3A66|nr:pre-mRNA-splicing factor 38 [Ctenocephalides felis]
MANRTVRDAKCIKGTNPQYLIEKIIRSRIYDSKYWKEECFALTAELLVDKAMELRYIGGVHGGNVRPSPFLCLVLKMLQIQPEKEIVVEFIRNEEFKYVRALGAYYMRLTGTSLDCYKYLEPLYNDNRKLRRQNRQSAFELVHMDEFIDELLHEERICDVILPRIQKRHVLEENNEIEPKISALDDDLDEDIPSEDEKMEESTVVEKISQSSVKDKITETKQSSKKRHRSREKTDRNDERISHRNREKDRSRSKERKRNRDHEREREREARHARSDDRERTRRESDRRDRDRERERERERGSRNRNRY